MIANVLFYLTAIKAIFFKLEREYMNIVESTTHKDFNIQIYLDEDTFSPRDWDNLATIVCFHNRYDIGDKHDFKSPDELQDFLKSNEVYYLPIYAYIHGGITISTTPFHCPFDSGQLGYIYITKKRVNDEGIRDPYKVLKQEVETYNDYLVGNCYGYSIYDKNGEFVTGCGGFIGHSDFCLSEARIEADYLNRTLPKQFSFAFA